MLSAAAFTLRRALGLRPAAPISLRRQRQSGFPTLGAGQAIPMLEISAAD